MERLNIWLILLVGSYFLTAMCLVTLGQPIRPVAHLVKATTFWFIATWLLLAVVLAAIRL